MAFGDGLQKGMMGTEGTFSIQAKDKYGNQLTAGGEKFDVKLDAKACVVCAMRVSRIFVVISVFEYPIWQRI